jgi:hypothetical protein
MRPPKIVSTSRRKDLFFNGIRDAAPDGWGRHLMDLAAGARALSEFDYLIATDDARVGALAFGPDLSGPKRIVPCDFSDPVKDAKLIRWFYSALSESVRPRPKSSITSLTRM